jgi:hypothetical protein
MALIHAHNMLDELMRNLVTRIAEGEGLDVNELVNKYLGPEAKPIEKTVPKKTRAAKVTVTEATTKCTAVTAQGKPCRLNALAGTCMCSVHSKKEATPAPKKSRRLAPSPEPEQDEAGPSAPPAPKKKPTKKKVRVPAPEHTHELDDEVHTDCELCQTHGSALAENDTEEFETVMSPRRSLRERLIAVAEEEDNYDDE